MSSVQKFAFSEKILFNLIYAEYEFTASLEKFFEKKTFLQSPITQICQEYIPLLNEYIINYENIPSHIELPIRQNFNSHRTLLFQILSQTIKEYFETTISKDNFKKIKGIFKELLKDYNVEAQQIVYYSEVFKIFKQEHLIIICKKLTNIIQKMDQLFHHSTSENDFMELEAEFQELNKIIENTHTFINKTNE